MIIRARFVLAFLTGLVLGGVVTAAAPPAQAPKEPSTSVLTGAPLGAVTLNHQAHAKNYGVKCEACHHPSKPQKALKTPHQKCDDCHTRSATPPMTTKRQAAFHDPTGKKGICIGCHQEANAKAKNAPVKCADCHKKA